MPTYLPDVPRHAIFGDITDPNKLFIVPEAEVSVELIRKNTSVEMFVKFKGQRVQLPHGAAVQFIQVQAITASGGIGFPESAPEASISKLHIPGKGN